MQLKYYWNRMKFVLITRYNIPVNFGQPGIDPLDEYWLEHRKNLFLNLCLPSVVNQTNQEFDWYLGFHPKTEIDFLDQLPKNAHVLRSLSGVNFLDQIRDKYLNEEFLVTARLDNDDSLANNFVDQTKNFGEFYVKNHEILGSKYALNWRSGCERDLLQQKFYERDFPASSFVCLFEKKSYGVRPVTVNYFHHAHISKHVPVANLSSTKPMWMINIHERNVGNIIKGTNAIPISDFLEQRFSLKSK